MQIRANTLLFFSGELNTKGLVVPMTKDIYAPILKRLEQEGLQFISKSTIIE